VKISTKAPPADTDATGDYTKIILLIGNVRGVNNSFILLRKRINSLGNSDLCLFTGGNVDGSFQRRDTEGR